MSPHQKIRAGSVKFGEAKIKIETLAIEKLIDGVKILHSPYIYNHIIVTDDLSKAVTVEKLSIIEIKAILGNHQSVKALFDHLDWLNNRKTPILTQDLSFHSKFSKQRSKT
ncbi:MAG: hypothetical protein ACFFDT_04900 [Candidatus Hodarchaeota archaeon]